MCALKPDRPKALSREDAETIALRALGFLAEDPKRLQRFMSLTGLEPGDLSEAAETAPIQAAVLDYLLGDESLLMVFCGHASLRPDAVPAARALLDGPSSGGRD
jgi:hypothetical protein